MTKAGREAKGGSPWFAGSLRPLTPLDPADARNALAEFGELTEENGLARLSELCASGSGDAAFLGSVFDLSEFMRDSARRQPEALERLFDTSVAKRLAEIEAAIRSCPMATTRPGGGLMKNLRLLKGARHISSSRSTTWPAGGCVRDRRAAEPAGRCFRQAAIDFLLRDAHEQGKLKLRSPIRESSGFIVLGMGKLGAQELNLSSDIDLIVFFDRSAGNSRSLRCRRHVRAADAASLRILQDRTERLRLPHGSQLQPDPARRRSPSPCWRRCITRPGQNWGRGDDQGARSRAT